MRPHPAPLHRFAIEQQPKLEAPSSLGSGPKALLVPQLIGPAHVKPRLVRCWHPARHAKPSYNGAVPHITGQCQSEHPE